MLTEKQIGDIVQRAFEDVPNDPIEAATWAAKLVLNQQSELITNLREFLRGQENDLDVLKIVGRRIMNYGAEAQERK